MYEAMKMKMSDWDEREGNAALSETSSHLCEYDCVCASARTNVCTRHNTGTHLYPGESLTAWNSHVSNVSKYTSQNECDCEVMM